MLEQQDGRMLIDLVRWRALHISDGEPFKLASGRTSPYFFDMKPVILDPTGARIIASTILKIIEYLEVKQVGGMESGAIPIVASVVHASGNASYQVDGFYVRKQPKARGTMQLIEGNLTAGKRTAILEDVTTTGGMSLKAVQEARKVGCVVENVITVLDREEGSSMSLEKEGITLIPLLTIRDVLPEKARGA
jgi:orotate phosphoribosyltransferase